MKLGLFGDVHATKNMRGLQNLWEDSVTSSILEMYKKFDEENIELAVCLGDFFDTPKIEAKHLHLLLPLFMIMNSKDYPTYILLGNHEIDDSEHNILEYLSEYPNIKPVTNWDIIREDLLFIPYSVDPRELEDGIMKDKYVFTHHDIYGSALAGGKTKAFFGLETSIFKEAKRVFNGHVHLKSKVCDNIINAGSLLASQQGEMKLGTYPSYYIVDTSEDNIIEYNNEHSMIYLTVNLGEVEKASEFYSNHEKLILKIEYEGVLPTELKFDLPHISFRKLIDTLGVVEEEVINHTSFDLKNYLSDYITKDINVIDKEGYIKTGLELLD